MTKWNTAEAAEDFVINEQETNLCEKMYLHVWKRRTKLTKVQKHNADQLKGWVKVKDVGVVLKVQNVWNRLKSFRIITLH